MKITPRTKIPKDVWDKIILESTDGWLYQTYDWIDFAERAGSRSLSFGVQSDSGEILAVCPLFFEQGFLGGRVGLLRFLRSLPLTRRLLQFNVLFDSFAAPGGPAIVRSQQGKARQRIIQFIYDHIETRIAPTCRADILRVRRPMVTEEFHLRGSGPHNPYWDAYIWEGLSGIPPRLATILDLSLSEADLRMNMNVSCRNQLNQAERAGLTFKEGGKEFLDKYVKLHQSSLTRTGTNPHNESYFANLWRALDGERHQRFFYAEKDGCTLAAVHIHFYKNGATYWGGCSEEFAKKFRANQYVLWNAIKWAKEAGVKYFEVGLFEVFPGTSMKEYSVGRFKSQFSKSHFRAIELEKSFTKKGDLWRAQKQFALHCTQKKRLAHRPEEKKTRHEAEVVDHSVVLPDLPGLRHSLPNANQHPAI